MFFPALASSEAVGSSARRIRRFPAKARAMATRLLFSRAQLVGFLMKSIAQSELKKQLTSHFHTSGLARMRISKPTATLSSAVSE